MILVSIKPLSPTVVRAQGRSAQLAKHATIGIAAIGDIVLVGQVAHVQRPLGARPDRTAQCQAGPRSVELKIRPKRRLVARRVVLLEFRRDADDLCEQNLSR